MKVQNKRTGKIFETCAQFFNDHVVGKGNGDLYTIIEDDAPIEVKFLRKKKEDQKK